MVQIPQYQQQVGLDAPTRQGPQVDTRVDNSIGQGLAQLGGAITNVSEAINRRNRQKAEFNAKIGYDTLQEKLQQSLVEAERNAPADGSGIHDNFMLSVRSKEVSSYLDSITDPEIRERYKTIIDTSDAEHWSNIAANTEFKLGNTYSVNNLTEMWTKRGQGVVADPSSVKAYVDEMIETIDKAPNLTAAQREEMKDKIRIDGPKIAAASLQQTDPEALFFASGRGTREQRLGFLGRRLQAAVIGAESNGDASAVSPVGAVGLMQVMPDTAVEIAKKLGDTAFLGLSREQQVEFLKNPENSKRYGTTYLSMMLDKHDGDVEAALVAYNAGPGNADKWLEKGRDYNALPKPEETQPYVQKVFGNMGAAKLASGKGTQAAVSGTGNRIPIQMGTQAGRQPAKLEGVNSQVISTWEQVQGDFGRALPVVSGHRDEATNAAAGGAKKSQHIKGTALDIDVSGLSKDERVKLIQLASAHGFTGIGIYKNSIHVDMREGGPVTWGSSFGKESVPAWAFHVAAQHREGAYNKGGRVQLADASGTGGLTMNDAGPQFADGVPGGGAPAAGSGEGRSGFVSPIFADLPAADLLEIQSQSTTAFTKAQQAQIVQRTADEILALAGASDDKAGDSKAAYGALDAIQDAEIRKDVTTLVDSHFTRWTRIEKDQEDAEYARVSGALDPLIQAGNTAEALKLVTSSNLGAKEKDAFRTLIAKGPVSFDDPQAEQELTSLYLTDPQKFASIDLARDYKTKLTTDTLVQLKERQTKINDGTSEEAKAIISTVNTASKIIDSNLEAMGLTTGAKAKPADVAHANMIRSVTTKEIERLQMKLGRPPLISELDETVRSVMKAYPRTKPIDGWFSNDADVDLLEITKAYEEEKLDISQAAEALRRKGDPVNGQTLQDLLDLYKAKNAQ